MSEPFLGEIRTFAGNFAPRGWALCNGQLLSISQNTALFSILGTSFGGNGTTNFALPNLQARAPMHWGNGPGLTPRDLGEASGSSSATLTSLQLPAHTHQVGASASAASALSPAGNLLADAPLYAAPPLDQVMAAPAVGTAGGSQPHDNMQPYLGLTFIIATQGLFPSRS